MPIIVYVLRHNGWSYPVYSVLFLPTWVQNVRMRSQDQVYLNQVQQDREIKDKKLSVLATSQLRMPFVKMWGNRRSLLNPKLNRWCITNVLREISKQNKEIIFI